MSTEMEVARICVGLVALCIFLTVVVSAFISHKSAKDAIKYGLIVIPLFAVFLYLGAKTSENSGNNGQNNKPDNKVVWVVAEDYVRTQLLNPSGAKFCSYSEATISYTEKTGIYTVKGWVDSTNAYGATIRSNFACNLELTGNGYKNASAIFY